MAKIKMKDLNHPNLLPSLGVVRQKIVWKTPKDILHCVNVTEDVLKRVEDARKVYKTLIEQHAKVEKESGEIILDDKKQPVIEDEKAMQKAFEEMLETEVEIMGKLDMSRAVKCELTAEELAPVRFMLHDL